MKTVLITGGAVRLGRALVEHFAAQGWRVIFTSQWHFEEGMALAGALGDSVHCLRAQVSSQSNGALIAQFVQRYTDSLDLLICNASTFKRISVENTRPDEFQDLLDSNLLGPFFLAQQCLPMIRGAGGNIINIADAQVEKGVAQFTAYAAAKAGLISITKSMALELAPDVRVNAILPGSLPWPVGDEEYPPAARGEIVKQIPLGRIGQWDEIVDAVGYLNMARFVTGTCMPVDGGRSAVF